MNTVPIITQRQGDVSARDTRLFSLASNISLIPVACSFLPSLCQDFSGFCGAGRGGGACNPPIGRKEGRNNILKRTSSGRRRSCFLSSGRFPGGGTGLVFWGVRRGLQEEGLVWSTVSVW